MNIPITKNIYFGAILAGRTANEKFEQWGNLTHILDLDLGATGGFGGRRLEQTAVVSDRTKTLTSTFIGCVSQRIPGNVGRTVTT